jgi:sugar lactone lactonase YvrE
VTTFASGVPLADWREELAFDGHGGMWVSRLHQNVVERYAPSGAVLTRVQIPGPGGVALGPDGLLYVNSLPDFGGVPQVYRFDPLLSNPIPKVFVANLPGVNGSAFDGQGNLYISTETAAPSVLKIRPDGSRDTSWEKAASFSYANGLVVAGQYLYAARTEDQRSPIEQVPLSDPAAHKTIADLSFGVASAEPALHLPPNFGAPLIPKGLDDLTVGPDGMIYVVAFLTGELLRVNPTTGEACVVVSGLTMPTAVQFPISFGHFSHRNDPFVVDAAGDVLHVSLNP